MPKKSEARPKAGHQGTRIALRCEHGIEGSETLVWTHEGLLQQRTSYTNLLL